MKNYTKVLAILIPENSYLLIIPFFSFFFHHITHHHILKKNDSWITYVPRIKIHLEYIKRNKNRRDKSDKYDKWLKL